METEKVIDAEKIRKFWKLFVFRSLKMMPHRSTALIMYKAC